MWPRISTKKRAPITRFIALFVLLLTSNTVLAADLAPSANTAVILPGLHEAGESLNGEYLSERDVIDWELDNSDVVFGSYPERADNERTNAIGYMYNQKLEINSGELEHALRSAAEDNNLNYEDFFLHFAEDTILAEVEPSHGENTLLNRKPMIVGYTADEDHAGFWLYQTPPWDADVFANFAQGGALYVYHSEPFDRLQFQFSQFATGGSFVLEYPSAVDGHGQVSEWSQLAIKKDKTLNFSRNQTVIWHVPDDWQRATTHDGSGASYGGGQYFGSAFVRDGGRLYVTRIRWQGDESAQRPKLNDIKLKNSFAVVKNLTNAPITTADGLEIQRWRKIRGFDVSADLNQDNYLSPTEYRNRSNKQATARFRWEARVIPFGRMWSQASSWALTDLSNSDYQALMAEYYREQWAEQGLKGAYNDDTNKLLGANQFTIYSGGTVAELAQIAGSEQADVLYQQQFADFLKALGEQTDGLISVNIGTANLYGRNGQSHLQKAAKLYLREHYIVPSTGFSGYAGLAKFWDNAALAEAGQKVIFQATTRYGRVQYLGNSEVNWRADQYSALAIYYLNSHPEHSYFNQWNSGYLYGSNNTSAENFWQAGVPKNIAYQPSQLLKIDLGQPAAQLPDGVQPIPLMLSTRTPAPADYTVIGNSADQTLIHTDLPNGLIPVTPTNTYFAYRSNNNVVPDGPAEMVLAREFSKGRVLYRTDFFGKNADFYQAEPITITLEQPMRPVDLFGNIGEYVNEVQLGGYQGLFLLY